jgi:hypothetical protein
MKKVNSCSTENCIPTPSSCIEWNGGEVAFLGVCNGSSLNSLMWEVLTKLQEITGDDLSSFDIDSLVGVCQAKAPLEVNLLTILETVRDNQLCLKTYIDALNDKLSELFQEKQLEVNLRCLADFDNLGNALIPNRKALDQLVIDQLCAQKSRIDTIEGELLILKSGTTQSTTTGQESFSTCIDSGVKTNQQQTTAVASALCELRNATGDAAAIAVAMSKVPADWNSKYSTINGWQSTLSSEAGLIGNLLLVIKKLEDDIYTIKTTCCAVSCEDIKVGFSASFNEDMTSVILKFSSGAGTLIPAGFTDKGSTVVIKDEHGGIETSSLGITNGLEEEVFIYSLNTRGTLTIELTYKLGNDSLVCEKTITKTVKSSVCEYCELTAAGTTGSSVVIVYQDPNANTTTDHVPVYQTTTTTTTIPI